jgi:6-phosphogluconolactonase
MLSINAFAGGLALLGRQRTQAGPRSFAITPDGRFLIAAGHPLQGLGVCAIDAVTGALRPCGEIEVGSSPGWVETLTLGSPAIVGGVGQI